MELPNPSFHLASLLRWLGTFNISVPHNSVEHLSDGVALAQVLKQIDSSWFDDNWLSKIKPDVGTNWRLKVSNLKKVLERVVDYYQESLGHSLAAFTLPDVNRIGEHGDRTETARLLQLVLGCAIYCDRKEDYIQNIMRLEEDVQQGIMRAIQELEASGMGGDSLAGFAGAGSVASKQVLLDALEVANEAKEQLSQRCRKLDQQLEAMQAERVSLQNEIERLQELLQERDGQSDVSGPAQPASDVAFRYRDLRQQVETLREEVYRLESSKEEYRVRAESLERELETLRSRQDELVSAAESARSLKDEVDILREAAGRAAKAEATAEGLRKRAEEYTELKRQMRRLEEKNEELLNQNLVLEEEVKKAGPWKSQLDLHKKQIAELQDHLSQERQKVDKFEFQSKKLQEKLDGLQLEKERLARERDTLKETNEELRFAQLATGGTPTLGLNLGDDNGGLETVDMIPPEVREKLFRLQRENARLLESRSKAVQENGCAEEEKAVLQAMVDDLKQREADLETQNRRLNQRLLALESELEELKALGSSSGRGQNHATLTEETEKVSRLERELSNKTLAVEELEVKLTEQEQRVAVLQEAVSRKEVEMSAMEARYKKYIDKAKKVLKTLESKGGGAADVAPEVVALKAELQEKDRIIESMEREAERNRLIREEADHLMTTAFYNLGMQLQRQAMDQRLGGAPASPSLLTRQRQAVARKASNLNQGDSYDY